MDNHRSLLGRIYSRQLCLLLTMTLFVGVVHAASVASVQMLENYRENFKNSTPPTKYIFVDADGGDQPSDGPGKIYILDITAREPASFIYSSEIDRLFKDHFSVMVDNESLISTPTADYLVLVMTRPHEYNPKSGHCAAGMGEDRAYLIAITDSGVKVLNRNFFNCAGSYRMVHVNEQPGYEIRDYKKGIDQAQSVRYLLQDGKLMRKENGPYKEEPQ